MIKKLLSNSLLKLVARLILGGIFLTYSIGKIADPATFAKEISNYQMMPYFTINLMALILPWIELACGVFLIAGIRQRAASAITGFMLIVFLIAIISAMARGLNINCGCFSHVVEYVGWRKVAEDTGQLILAVYIFFYPYDKLSLEKSFQDIN
jgi:uncharacterized membrane protein YphA (DoxX/SURF4 family)